MIPKYNLRKTVKKRANTSLLIKFQNNVENNTSGPKFAVILTISAGFHLLNKLMMIVEIQNQQLGYRI